MDQGNDLRRVVGLADLCEIMSLLFAYPSEDVAQGLCDGRLVEDALACLVDSGLSQTEAEALVVGFSSFDGCDPSSLRTQLGKDYSLLYLAPGCEVPIHPYESAFRHVALGCEGVPVLFRSSSTLDVERLMLDMGALPESSRVEPVDSIWGELAFLAVLYGSLFAAWHRGDSGAVESMSSKIAFFVSGHVLPWMPDFMKKTMERSRNTASAGAYAVFAELGLAALRLVADDVEKRG